MPSYICTVCGNTVTYPAGDDSLHEMRQHECALCYTVIQSRRFREPEPGASVMFGPAGPGIGDYLFKNYLIEQFIRRYPGVDIINVTGTSWAASKIGADLIFWADNAGIANPAPPGAIPYIITNEVHSFVKATGRVPGLWFEPEESAWSLTDLRKTVLVNFRGIDRCLEKNVTTDEAAQVFGCLEGLKKQGDIDSIIMIGNDIQVQDHSLPDYAIDLRGKLSLPEIACLCRRAMMTVGKDSGILHIAAAAGGYVVGWGYRLRQWIPIAAEGRAKCLLVGAHQSHINEAIIRTVMLRGIMLARYLPNKLPKWARR